MPNWFQNYLIQQIESCVRIFKGINSNNMSRVCELTGAKANNGMAVSHSHIRTKKLQQVNLQKKETLVGRRQKMGEY